MGVGDFIKSLKLREWINIGFFIVSLGMLIAGSVMLAIAIESIPPMPPYYEIPTTTPLPTLIPSVFFATSFASGAVWSSDLGNPASNAFQQLSNGLLSNISTSWASVNLSAPSTSRINAFSQSQNGVDFYSEFIFADSQASVSLIQSALTSAGYQTDVFVSPTSQCSGLRLVGTQTTSNPPTVQTTTTPMKTGAICDVTSNSLTNIFLVDVSNPIIGSLDDKLAKISNFLANAPALVNLDQNGYWTNQEFRVVVYGGNEPTPLGRAKNQQSWNQTLQLLNSSIVNPTFADGHELTDALRFVVNNYRPMQGVAGNIIIVADGFDFDEMSSSATIANVLKNQYSYSLGIILMGTSQIQQSVIQPLASDFAHFYPIDNIDYLNNPTVAQTQAQWTCAAHFPTAAPPTDAPTRIPLITTQPVPTTYPAKPTVSPSLPPIAGCQLNVLFLIDESQTMLLNGFTTAVQYAIKTATSLSKLNSANTFSYIVFNSAVVSESTGYTDLNTFIAGINTVKMDVGGYDLNVGLSEALNFINTKSDYDNDGVRSVLYFITDGNDNGGGADNIQNLTTTIRAKLQTEIVGVDLAETDISKSNVQKIVQFGVLDIYTQSVYVGVSTPSAILDDKLLNSTNYQLQCKDSSRFYTSITFVIETSEAEGPNYVDVQTRTVLNILSHYNGLISPFKISVSVVYFSAPDNLIADVTGQSGILYDHLVNGQNAIDTLNFTDFSPFGPASDLQLGFSLTTQAIRKGVLQNSNLVIFFARGAYEQFSNCCPDPTGDAAILRQLATVQGVVIGPYSSKSQLDQLTESNSIDANQIIGTSSLNSTQDRQNVSQQISDKIVPVIESFMANQYCPGVSGYVNPPCEDPIDVLILLHADDENNWTAMLNFTASQLIPDLLGSTGNSSFRSLTTTTPINFAIASYYYLDVLIHAEFTYLLTPNGYQNLVSSIPFSPTKGTATLSTAYKKAVEIFQDGRPYASKNLIVITDTMDISDMENAFSEHDAMVQQVGGFTSALTINTDTIPGADYQIDVYSYQLFNRYTSRRLANTLTQYTCSYVPVAVPTVPPPAPSPTLPGPIPVVKARNVWPDFTILIDTSVDSANPMTDVLFEKLRTFLDILLNQFSVGEKGSRFTIASFDGSTVDYSCNFAQTNNYYDLSSCRNEKLSFYAKSHQNYRNVNNVLKNVRQNVYENSTVGYRSLNENYLIIFTLGNSSTSFSQELSRIQRKGVRTIAIGLSSNLSNSDLSVFAQTAFMVSDWSSAFSGIDTNYNLADRIFQLTTKKRSPLTSNFYANLIYVVDQSVNTWNDHSNLVQYVSDSVTPFLIGDIKTKVSIVPFADYVNNPLPLSSSQTDVDDYLTNWRLTSTSTSITANIGNAVEYISTMIGTQQDRPTYVVFVLGSTNVTGGETAKQLLKSADLYVANFNSSVSHNFDNLVYSNDHIFSVESSQALLNRVVSMQVSSPNPILSLTTDIYDTQQGTDSVTFPTSAISADIILLLDETGLTDSDFSIVKQFMIDLTAKFTIGPDDTQFALQSYNGRTIPHDGFHLYESTSNDVVKQRIQKLTLAKAAENTTDADLAGAIEQELFFFLTESNGWRDDVTTYTIILSHADSFYDRDTTIAMGIRNVSTVFALGLNGQKFDYVNNFTNSGFYETVAGVTSLSINSPAVVDLITTIDNDYKKSIYPIPISPKDIVKADFIFLVDNYIGTGATQEVQNFLLTFMSNVGTFSNTGNDTKMAVVTYGSSVSTAWDLAATQDIQSIKDRISNLQIKQSSGSSNLRRAIDLVILNEAEFGVNPNRPTYIIVIAASSNISPNIDTSTSRHLNTRYSTFVIQTNYGNGTFAYTPQVLGTQLVADRVAYNPNLYVIDSSMNNFEPWISNEFTAWRTTFPDKS